MPIWRCVNHITGMCKPEPIFETKPKELSLLGEKATGIDDTYLAGATCSADYHNCGRYCIPKDPNPGMVTTGIHHTVVIKEKSDTGKKKKQKPLQGQLF